MVRSKLTKVVCCINPDYSMKDGEMSINRNGSRYKPSLHSE